ncbi:MAG: hypothetical protein RJB66_500 [Pseudomonadota bacterium]|jgi:DNA-binding response OmpR family regulator
MDLKQVKDLPSILWLEDNPGFVSLFTEEFTPHFKLTTLQSFAQLKELKLPDLHHHDALLIDMDLPEGKVGLDVIRYCKSVSEKTPVLVLSNDESLQSRLEMLSNGADDYLWKAMHPEEMIIRIRNSVNRAAGNKKEAELRLHGLRLLPHNLRANLYDQDVDLSKIEFQMLSMLVKKYPKPVTNEELRTEIWKLTRLETGTINTFLWKLNKKLALWKYRITKVGDTVLIQQKTPLEA